MNIYKNISILFLLVVGIRAMAQTGSIKGIIKTSDGVPAEFVTIGLKGQSKRVVASSKGEYEIKNIEAGSYTLVTSFVGLASQEQTIEVKANETTIVPEITLKEDAKALGEIVVSAGRDRDASEHVSKIPLKNLENSQVYTIIDKKTMETQQISNMESAMKNATGVYIVFPATGRAGDGGTYYTTRGFTTNASLINGIAGAVFSNPDASNVERIEVLKGPSATLFGSSLSSFGGAINVITKKPYDSLGGSVSVSGGSFELQRFATDINTPLNKSKTAFFRLNAAYHSQNSFQDFGFTKRIAVSPSFLYQPNDKLSLNLEANFSNIQATGQPWFYADSATTGVGSVDQLNIDYNKYYFLGDLYSTTKSSNVIGQINYKLSGQWKSQTAFSSSVNTSNGPLPYLYFVSPNQVMRLNQTLEGTTNQMNVQQNFTGDFNIGGLRNRLIAGADYYRNHSIAEYKDYSAMADLIYTNAANPNFTNYNKSKYDTTHPTYYYGSYSGISNQQRFGTYISDVINITKNLLLNAGIRYDSYKSDGNYDPVADTTIGQYKQSGFSPKLGLVYELFNQQVSLFANYQNGFQNVEGRDYQDKTFIPQKANQAEGGVKFNLFKNMLAGTISYYDITVTNSIRADLEHSYKPEWGNKAWNIQDGTQRSKGVEADIHLNIAEGLLITVGYAYNDNKYVKADEAVLGLRPVEAGSDQLVNTWINYTIPSRKLKGLGAGVGGNYASKKFAINEVSNHFSIPAWTVINASLFYDRPSFRVGVNVNNIASQKYWIGWNQLVPQRPRELVVSATWKF